VYMGGPSDKAGAQYGGPTARGDLIHALLELARAVLDVPVAFVSTVFEDHERIRTQVGALGPLRAGASAPLRQTLLGHVLTSRRTIAIADTRAHLLTSGSDWIRRLRAEAVLCVPFEGADGNQMGTLTVCSALPRRWTIEEIALLERIAAFGRLAADIEACHRDTGPGRGDRCGVNASHLASN
jgi:GAF domain-containing protein